MKKLLAVAVLAFLTGAISAHAATLVPTGGTLPNMTPDSVPAVYGQFDSEYRALVSGYLHGSEEWTTELATLGWVRSFYTTTFLNIGGSASTIQGDVMNTPGYVAGVLGFDLTESTSVLFSFAPSASDFPAAQPTVSVTLRNAADQIVLGCVSNSASVGTGCLVGLLPDDAHADGRSMMGLIQLAAGHYDVHFDASTLGAVNGYTAFGFDVTTVPVPGTAWLLVSGLGLLARRRRAARGE